MKALQRWEDHYRLFHPDRGGVFLLAQSDLSDPPPSQKQPLSEFSWLFQCLKKIKHFFSQAWKHFYISPPLPPPPHPVCHLFTPSGQFHLEGVWFLSPALLELALSLSLNGENGP